MKLCQAKLIRQNSKRNIKFPSKVSVELAEMIGIHFGDGSLYKDKKYNYVITYSGNLKSDKEYMDFIFKLFFKLFNIHLKKSINPKNNSITLTLRSKDLFYFYKDCLKLPVGKKKDLSIPYYIKDNKKFLIAFLRGLFDTDGCVTLQKSGKYRYPLIKICTKHENFANEISKSLAFLYIPSFITKKENLGSGAYDVTIRNVNARKFLRIIGSKNERNIKGIINKWGWRDLNPHLGS